MKRKTILTITALVAFAGAAAAEIIVTGTARIGLQTTEGTAAVAAKASHAASTAADKAFVDAVKAVATNLSAKTGARLSAGTLNMTAVTIAELADLDVLIVIVPAQTTGGTSETLRTNAANDLKSLNALRSRIAKGAVSVAVAKTEDKTAYVLNLPCQAQPIAAWNMVPVFVLTIPLPVALAPVAANISVAALAKSKWVI